MTHWERIGLGQDAATVKNLREKRRSGRRFAIANRRPAGPCATSIYADDGLDLQPPPVLLRSIRLLQR